MVMKTSGKTWQLLSKSKFTNDSGAHSIPLEVNYACTQCEARELRDASEVLSYH